MTESINSFYANSIIMDDGKLECRRGCGLVVYKWMMVGAGRPVRSPSESVPSPDSQGGL